MLPKRLRVFVAFTSYYLARWRVLTLTYALGLPNFRKEASGVHRVANRYVLFLILIVQGQLYAASGAEIAKQCDDCHGTNGQSEKDDVPSIGGFSDFGIVDLLESYRNGSRQARSYKTSDGQETDMAEISRSLSEDDAMSVAEHYASQQWQPHEQTFDAALARRGAQIHDIKCDKCHSEHGGAAVDDLAIMLGQWRNYLEMEFQDFDSGERKMARKMREKYETLSAADKKAILELYVSGGNL